MLVLLQDVPHTTGVVPLVPLLPRLSAREADEQAVTLCLVQRVDVDVDVDGKRRRRPERRADDTRGQEGPAAGARTDYESLRTRDTNESG